MTHAQVTDSEKRVGWRGGGQGERRRRSILIKMKMGRDLGVAFGIRTPTPPVGTVSLLP